MKVCISSNVTIQAVRIVLVSSDLQVTLQSGNLGISNALRSQHSHCALKNKARLKHFLNIPKRQGGDQVSFAWNGLDQMIPV